MISSLPALLFSSILDWSVIAPLLGPGMRLPFCGADRPSQQALTFPGRVFRRPASSAPVLDSAAWIYFFWHFGFPAGSVDLCMVEDRTTLKIPQPNITAIRNWLERGDRDQPGCADSHGLPLRKMSIYPRLFTNITNMTPLVFRFGVLTNLLNALALCIAFGGEDRSLLDQWLIVVTVALISEMALVTLFENLAPSVFGFYAGRIFNIHHLNRLF